MAAIYAGVMELADVTDSKSVGSNTVRVRPPPPAPKSEDDTQWVSSSLFGTAVWMGEPAQAGKARMPYYERPKALHGCKANRAFIIRHPAGFKTKCALRHMKRTFGA